MTRVDELSAGGVGYCTSSIKSIHDVHIGDTITLSKKEIYGCFTRVPQASPYGFLRTLSYR